MTADQIYDTNNLRSTFAQSLAAAGFSLYSVNIGIIFAMPTIVIGDLRGKDSPLGLTETQASWFGSLYFITQPIGSLVSGFLQDWLGRKRTLMMSNVPQLTAWAILYFSSSTTHLFLSVALMGLSIGFLEAPILSYIGEISQPRLRGIFSSFLGIFYNAGMMIEAFLGAGLPWRTMVLCNIGVPVVGLVAMTLLPDSPAWLVTKGRVEDAEKAFQWLRGWVSPEAVKMELDTLVCYVRDTQGHNKNFQSVEYEMVTGNEGTQPQKRKSTWRVLLEPEVRVAFRIVMIFFITSPFATLFGMRPFFIEILNSIDVPVDAHSVVAACGVLTMLGSVTMGALMKVFGKRKLTFLSMSICIACCAGLGGYFAAGLHEPWLPVGLFCLSYYFGAIVNQLPWIMLIELFPLRARSIGSGFCAAFAYAVYFVITKTYYNMAAWLDVSGTCFLNGFVGLLGLVYLYMDLPETEGQALEDIERQLSERRSSKKRSIVKNSNEVQIKEGAKSMGSSICAAASYLFSFVVTKTYYNAVTWLDVSGTCFLYGGVGLLGLVYLYLELPETEGQALEDIERRLSERRLSRRKPNVENVSNRLQPET